MKCRCAHGVAWFAVCPWCDVEIAEAWFHSRQRRWAHLTLRERIADLTTQYRLVTRPALERGRLLPALSDTSKRACLAWGPGPMSLSQYAYLFSYSVGREVSHDEALAIINEANYRDWVARGCPVESKIGDIERSMTSFWRGSL